jgi:hypothetical protein
LDVHFVYSNSKLVPETVVCFSFKPCFGLFCFLFIEKR